MGCRSNTYGENRANTKTWSLDDFEIGQELGKGAFGQVYVVKEKSGGLICGMKVIHRRYLAQEKVEYMLQREVEIQSRLRHPHVLKMYTLFQDETRIFMILEFASLGNIYELSSQQPNFRFENTKAARFLGQIAEALQFCHEHGVIHRDIKMENILLSYSEDVKIADFGMSIHSPHNLERYAGGTLDYMAPELIKFQPYNNTVDIWSLGVLCFELLTGVLPFRGIGNSEREIKNRIKNVDYIIPSFVHSQAKYLIEDMLLFEKEERLPIPEVLADPWLVAYRELDSLKREEETEARRKAERKKSVRYPKCNAN